MDVGLQLLNTNNCPEFLTMADKKVGRQRETLPQKNKVKKQQLRCRKARDLGDQSCSATTVGRGEQSRKWGRGSGEERGKGDGRGEGRGLE